MFLMSRLADVVGLQTSTVIRLFLAIAEMGLMVVLYRFLERIRGARFAFRILLVGVALNPVCLTQIVVHANFDVLVGTLAALAVIALLRYQETRDETRLVEASLWLGIGILLKTVPLVLTPLLFLCLRGVRARVVLVCALLVAGPWVVGASTLFLVSPPIVAAKVLHYHSIGGYFGVSGLLAIAGVQSTTPGDVIFKGAMVACLMVVGVGVRQRGLPRAIVLGAPLLLLAIPTFGPGFGPQYAYWSIPLMLLAFPMAWRPTRLSIIALALVAAPDYLVEYGFLPSHGAFAEWMMPHDVFTSVMLAIGTPRGATLLRIPLFLGCLATVFCLARELLHQSAASGASHHDGLGESDRRDSVMTS
ncbi:MAG TPA: hypothetical protein VGP07_04420 [Polyangia bacterium]